MGTTTRYKTIAWVLAAGLPAVVGGLYGPARLHRPGSPSTSSGTQYFMMMLLGGL